MSDLNIVCLIGRLTKNAELGIAGNNTPYWAFSIATRRSRLADGEWTETPHYFDFRLFGEKWRGLGERLTRGCMVSIQGRLEQDKWERDGRKHSGIRIAADRVRILGKAEQAGPGPEDLPDPAPSEHPGAAETGGEDG
ncbi:MAG: single-stranded DNA-binding protein [Treponema sp.]|jgi:single-strand DNA-binding protein|nr:single-stranded DNA-binding protein [Treponema sp.]